MTDLPLPQKSVPRSADMDCAESMLPWHSSSLHRPAPSRSAGAAGISGMAAPAARTMRECSVAGQSLPAEPDRLPVSAASSPDKREEQQASRDEARCSRFRSRHHLQFTANGVGTGGEPNSTSRWHCRPRTHSRNFCRQRVVASPDLDWMELLRDRRDRPQVDSSQMRCLGCVRVTPVA